MASYRPRKPEKFRLPYNNFLEDLAPYINNKTVVISFFGASGINIRGCKVTLLDEILGYQVFRQTFNDEPEFDPEVMCTIEGCYDRKKNVLYLHLIGMYDDYLITKVIEECKLKIEEKGYFYVWAHLKSRFTRALLFLFHISHILVFNHTGPLLEMAFTNIFQTINLIRLEMLPTVQETLSQIPGVSPFWASSGRFCIPRVLWFFQTCPPEYDGRKLSTKSIRRVQRYFEIHILDVFGKGRFVSDASKNSLFLFPREMDFVFMVFEEESNQIYDPNFILNSMIANLRNPDSVKLFDQLIEFGMERHRPSQPTVEERYEAFLQAHIDRAFTPSGFGDGSTSEINSIFPTEIPTLGVLLEAMNTLYFLMVRDHPKATGPMSYLVELMNLDERFSDATCARALSFAVDAYMKDLPVFYNGEDHEKRLELAVRVFREHGRGPFVNSYLNRLTADLTRYWKSVREMREERNPHLLVQSQLMHVERRVELDEAAAVIRGPRHGPESAASQDLGLPGPSYPLTQESQEYQWMGESTLGLSPDSFAARMRGPEDPPPFNMRKVEHEFPPLLAQATESSRGRKPISVLPRPTPAAPAQAQAQNLALAFQRLEVETAKRAGGAKPDKKKSSRQRSSELNESPQTPRPQYPQYQCYPPSPNQHYHTEPSNLHYQGLPEPPRQYYQGIVEPPNQQQLHGIPEFPKQNYQGLPEPPKQHLQGFPQPPTQQFIGLPELPKKNYEGLQGFPKQQYLGLPELPKQNYQGLQGFPTNQHQASPQSPKQHHQEPQESPKSWLQGFPQPQHYKGSPEPRKPLCQGPEQPSKRLPQSPNQNRQRSPEPPKPRYQGPEQAPNKQFEGLPQHPNQNLQGSSEPLKPRHQGPEQSPNNKFQGLPKPAKQHPKGSPEPPKPRHQGPAQSPKQNRQGSSEPLKPHYRGPAQSPNNQYQVLPRPPKQNRQRSQEPPKPRYQGPAQSPNNQYQGLPRPPKQNHQGSPKPPKPRYQGPAQSPNNQIQGLPRPLKQNRPGSPETSKPRYQGPEQSPNSQFHGLPKSTKPQFPCSPEPLKPQHPEERKYYERMGALPRDPTTSKRRSLGPDFPPLPPPRDFPSLPSPRDFPSLPQSCNLPSFPPACDFGPLPPALDFPPLPPVRSARPSVSDSAVQRSYSASQDAAEDTKWPRPSKSRSRKKDKKQHLQDKKDEPIRASSHDSTVRPSSPADGDDEINYQMLVTLPRNLMSRQQRSGSGDHRRRDADAMPHPVAFDRATNPLPGPPAIHDLITAVQNLATAYRELEASENEAAAQGVANAPRYKPPKYQRRNKPDNK